MKTNINDISGSKKEIVFEVPAEEFKKYIEREDDMKKASQKMIQEKYLEFVKESHLTPVSPPQVEVIKMAPGNDASFKVTINVLPDIELPDLKEKLSDIEEPETEVTDEELQENLEALQKSRAQFEDLDRPAQEGDFVHIKFKSSLEDEERQDRFILGEGQLIPGFEEELKEMKKGDKKEFTLTYPDEYYQEEQAGKEADFKVEMVGVQEMELPEINDDFAKELGEFDNLKQLKDQVRTNLEQNKQKQADQKLHQEILGKIKEELEVELPKTVIEAEKQRLLKVLKQNVQERLNLSFGDYLDKIKKTEAELKDSFTDQARANTLDYLILQKVGQQEEIKVNPKEIKKEADQFMKKIPQEKKEDVKEEQVKDYVRQTLYNQKVFTKLKSYVQS